MPGRQVRRDRNDALLGWIDLAATYNEDLRDYSQIRVWAGMRQFSPSIAGEYDVSRRWDIFAVPDEKIRIDDVMEYMRYRLEGTEYSCDTFGQDKPAE